MLNNKKGSFFRISHREFLMYDKVERVLRLLNAREDEVEDVLSTFECSVYSLRDNHRWN